jgi:hypothetical protein
LDIKQGKYGLWYVPGINHGFASKEAAERHLAKEAEEKAFRHAVKTLPDAKPDGDGKFLGYGKMEWVLGAVVGIPAIWYAWYAGSQPDEVVARERASASEVMECKDRIESSFSGAYTVDVSVITGTASDKQGPGGTSRVFMGFELTAPGGVVTKHTGICQFADGVPSLSVRQR